MTAIGLVKDLAAQGQTDTEIARAVGLARTTVQGIRKKHGIPAARAVGKTRRGEAPGSGKVSIEYPNSGEFTPVATQKKPISVAEFLLNKRRAVCPICQLKEPIKAMVVDAKKKGERQQDIIEYLQACHKINVTPRDFSAHISGRHDA